jgi:hypothetical protein
MDYLAGVAAVLALWVLYRVLAHTWNPWDLVIGADGRASTSKLQWLVWTVVVFFAYVATYVARARQDHFGALDEVPQNVLIALGLSATTMAAAKAITVSYVSGGKIVKPPVDQPTDGTPPAAGPGAVMQDDAGGPDLSKIQMLGWTGVAVGIYLITVIARIGDIRRDVRGPNEEVLGLPDIDAALMVLMGLAEGAYLGKKLVTTQTPRLIGISPVQGPPGTLVTLSGQSLGEQTGGQITLDGLPISPDQLTWQDASVSFAIPATYPGGAAWSPPQRITLGVLVAGQTAVNPQPFIVTAA